MTKTFILLILALFCWSNLSALDLVPFSNLEIEKANQYLKKSTHSDKLCVGGKKVETTDGHVYLAKCRTDAGNFFMIGFAVYPNKEWELKSVTAVTDKD